MQQTWRGSARFLRPCPQEALRLDNTHLLRASHSPNLLGSWHVTHWVDSARQRLEAVMVTLLLMGSLQRPALQGDCSTGHASLSLNVVFSWCWSLKFVLEKCDLCGKKDW